MASPIPHLLARSLRSALAASGAAASSSSASSSSSVAASSAIRTFTTTPLSLAKAPNKAKAPPGQKRKSVVKKLVSGPRSPGSKRKGGAGEAGAATTVLTTPFYRSPPTLSSLSELSPLEANSTALNRIVAFSKSDLDAFARFGIEQKLHKALYSHPRPACLVRETTLKLYDTLAASASASKPNQIALTGPLSGGKSHLLLQAVSYGLASDWLVIYLPRLINFINSTTSFVHSPEEQAYLQPQLLQQIFSTILSQNANVLKQIKVDDGKSDGKEIQLARGLTVFAGHTTLDQLLKTATQHAAVTPLASQRIFDLFLSSIAVQTQVPTLLAMDDIQALYLPTQYKTPDYETIQSYELAPVRSLIKFLVDTSAGKGLQKGTILGAVSHSQTKHPVPTEFKVIASAAAAAASEGGAKKDNPLPNLGAEDVHAYTQIDTTHLKHVQASGWDFTTFPITDRWETAELKQLFELRRREGRNWNGGNISNSISRSSEAIKEGATKTEDELFLLRLMESGRNPATFEKSVRGGSIL